MRVDFYNLVWPPPEGQILAYKSDSINALFELVDDVERAALDLKDKLKRASNLLNSRVGPSGDAQRDGDPVGEGAQGRDLREAEKEVTFSLAVRDESDRALPRIKIKRRIDGSPVQRGNLSSDHRNVTENATAETCGSSTGDATNPSLSDELEVMFDKIFHDTSSIYNRLKKYSVVLQFSPQPSPTGDARRNRDTVSRMGTPDEAVDGACAAMETGNAQSRNFSTTVHQNGDIEPVEDAFQNSQSNDVQEQVVVPEQNIRIQPDLSAATIPLQVASEVGPFSVVGNDIVHRQNNTTDHNNNKDEDSDAEQATQITSMSARMMRILSTGTDQARVFSGEVTKVPSLQEANSIRIPAYIPVTPTRIAKGAHSHSSLDSPKTPVSARRPILITTPGGRVVDLPTPKSVASRSSVSSAPGGSPMSVKEVYSPVQVLITGLPPDLSAAELKFCLDDHGTVTRLLMGCILVYNTLE